MKLHIWPSPPEMSEGQYAKYRRGLAAGIAFWIACFGVCAFFWDALPFLLKAVVAVGLFVVGPDIDAVEQLFTPYEKYKEERGSKSE